MLRISVPVLGLAFFAFLMLLVWGLEKLFEWLEVKSIERSSRGNSGKKAETEESNK